MSKVLLLIPKPVQCQRLDGVVHLDGDASVWFEPDANGDVASNASDIVQMFNRRTGLDLTLSLTQSKASIHVPLRESLSGQAREAYTLNIEADLIVIEGNDPAGVFYGFETLTSLVTQQDRSDAGVTLPTMKLSDQPRFGWRGLMLDVTRHFQPVPTVLKLIDIMASLKLNRLHLHLCDDEAWRLEIPGYPRLTEVAAWRPGPDGPEGGFYSAEDIAEILAHAKNRMITVIPEIEMPAHCNAALVAYPELGCDGALPVDPKGGWNAYTTQAGRRAFCCGEPGVFRFLEDVLKYVDDLFDPPLLHVGGDERPERAWRECRKCRRAMKEQGIESTAKMQAHFMEQVATFCRTQLKKPTAAWSDNLAEGAPLEQVVHAWYPNQAAIAARLGHDTINSNHEWTYLDYPATVEGLKTRPDWMMVLPLERVYHFDPVPDGLEPGLSHRVLGSEAAIWTEFLDSEETLMGNLLPRLVAFAEVLWSPANGRTYDEFAQRLAHWAPPATAIRSAVNTTTIPQGSRRKPIRGPATTGA